MALASRQRNLARACASRRAANFIPAAAVRNRFLPKHSAAAGTNPATEREMANKPSDARSGERVRPADPWRNRPWQRAHRGHHELHEHVESERHARCRFARKEGRRTRLEPQFNRQGFTRARLAHRQRLFGQDRFCNRISTSSASISSATACTTCIGQFRPTASSHRRRGREKRSRRRVGAVRQPQFRGARSPEHQGEFLMFAATRRRVRARGPRGH